MIFALGLIVFFAGAVVSVFLGHPSQFALNKYDCAGIAAVVVGGVMMLGSAVVTVARVMS